MPSMGDHMSLGNISKTKGKKVERLSNNTWQRQKVLFFFIALSLPSHELRDPLCLLAIF
jgi:hypothetical protein